MLKSLKLTNKKLTKHKNYLLFILATVGLYFVRIFLNIISFKPDGFYAGHQNVWSDWALHISLTNTFANKPINEWFLYHPYFSGGKLTYAFLTNAISGLLMKLGLNIVQAMVWPSIILIILFLIGIYFLFYQILNSRKKAVLGIFIYLTSAGPGFIKFVNEFVANPSLELLKYPPIDYTRMIKYNWLAGNIPTAMLVPQRAFLLGITLGVWSLFLLINAIELKKNSKNIINHQKKLLFAGGILAGLLPIAHMHSFIAVVIISGLICFADKNNYKKLIYYVLPAGLLSIFLYFKFVYGGIQIDNFMKILIGWTSEKNLFSWIKMWWELWGIMIPTAIISAMMLYQKNKTKLKYFYGFFALFIIANIIIFQPTAWDNTKIFAWAYVGFSLLAAHLIIELWKKSSKKEKGSISKIKKIIAIIIIILLSSTGILELIRLQNFDRNTYILTSAEEIEFAKKVMINTKTDDIFLTSTAHNNPLQMWGSRSIVLGYKGWVPNFGFDISTRDNDVRNIFENTAESLNLIKKYNISYIVVGAQERLEFKVNYEFLNKTFPISFSNSKTIIYKVK
ncbi:MAG: hypothetical protein H6772_04750 [Pseudomonadales bacterium]|nr:hypothetical protein [Pseudomonadales bacterium]